MLQTQTLDAVQGFTIHTIFPHCSVVTQEELEHRLLDQLSERLQTSEAQLREEMGRKVSGGAMILCVYMSPLHVLHLCSCVECPCLPFPLTQGY